MANNDTYAKLIIDFQAKVDNMERNTARAAASLDKFKSTAMSIGNVLTGGLFAAGIVGAVTGFARMAKSAIDSGDLIAKQSQRLGMTAQEYQTVALAAELSGQNIETVSKMIDMLSKKLADASRGGPAAEIFERIGLDPKALMANTTVQNLQIIFEAINNISNATLRAEAHMKLFGKSGNQAAIFTRDFVAAMERAQKTTKFGPDEKELARLEELKDKYTEILTKIDQFKMKWVVGADQTYEEIKKAISGMNPQRDINLLGEWSPFIGDDPFGMRELEQYAIGNLSLLEKLKYAANKLNPQGESGNLLDVINNEMNKRPEYQWLIDQQKKETEINEEDAAAAEEIIRNLTSASQSYAEKMTEVFRLQEKGLLTYDQSKARQAELRAELEKNSPMLAEAARMADQYADSLASLSARLDAVIEASKNVPEKVTSDVVAEAGGVMGREAWTTIQGEQIYKSTDAARQYRLELDALQKALDSGRISKQLFDQAAAYGEQQFNDTQSAGMFSAIEAALNALDQNRINSTTEALQEMAQVQMDGLQQELQSVADMFREIESFARGEFLATRNPFEEYAMHMEKLDMADMLGMIDPDTYMRSAMQAAYDMDRALGLDELPQMGAPVIVPPSAPGTAGFSTASQIAGVLAGAAGSKDIAKLQLTEAQKMNTTLTRVAANLERGFLL